MNKLRKRPKVALMIENSREHGRGLLRGIANYATENGPWAFYRDDPLYYRQPEKIDLVAALKRLEIDGIIMRECPQAEEIIETGIPAVIAPYTTKKFQKTAQIIIDNIATGQMGAEHLIGKGYKNLAFCGFNDMPWSRERGQGFAQRAQAVKLTVNFYDPPEEVLQSPWGIEQKHMIQWIKKLKKPVGVMACNDDRSEHFCEACQILDVKIPQEVAILGVSNDEVICNFISPPLSSIARNHEIAGYNAAKILDELMAGKNVAYKRAIVKPIYVAVRQSTDFLAINDRDVIKAEAFIYKHTHETIQVGDVAEHIGISRRTLEQKFQKELNRTILDEISRIRIDKITQMLVESNLSVAQIALAMGFSSEKHISRYFSQRKEMSPIQYRKQYGKR